ncbi:MAG: lipopolysaccharide transport periplasmic protein LptA [Wenzhouxiangella sp.]
MYRASCILVGLGLVLILALPPTTLSADQRQQRILINAEDGAMDMRTGVQTLVGNVRIAQGDLVVNADEGRAFNVDGEWRRVELFGTPTTWRMVMEDGGVTTGQSEQLIYDLIDEQITMIGDARIEDAQGSFTGARLTYSLVTERIEGTGGVELVIEPGERRPRPPQAQAPQADDPEGEEGNETSPPPAPDA